MSCKVCKHPNAVNIMREVFDGSLTYVEAAKKLALPVEDVWRCFADHWKMQSTDSGITLELQKADSVDDYVEILKGMIKKLIKKYDSALRMELTPMNVGAMTKLSAECRSSMRDVLEFQGKLQQGPLVQLNVMQVHMTKLTNWLINNLSPEDVQRLIKAIPELAQIEHVEEITAHS